MIIFIIIDSEEYVLLNPQHCLPEFLIHIQLVKNFESSAEAEVHNYYSTLQERVENTTRDFSMYSDPNSLQSSSKQRHEWLQRVDGFLSLDRSESIERKTEINGIKIILKYSSNNYSLN